VTDQRPFGSGHEGTGPGDKGDGVAATPEAVGPSGAGFSPAGPAGSAGEEGISEADLLPPDESPGEEDPLEVLARQRDEYREALVRLQADFENYKKRVRAQQADQNERAAAALVERILPVLDTADLALAHGGGEDVKQVASALYSALEREGLERIDPVGGSFDPTHHDAVAHEPGEVAGGGQEVAEVLRAGYRWKGRVLRAAMVKVRG